MTHPAREIIIANRKAIENSLAPPYTKHEHATAEGCTTESMRYWNFFLNTMEAYTKKEYTDSEGCTFLEVILWNRLLPKTEHFTKQEYSNTYGFSETNLVLWN